MGRIMSLRRIKSTRHAIVSYDTSNICYDKDPARTDCTVAFGGLIDGILNYIAEMFKC
jgi:hypothetical protein